VRVETSDGTNATSNTKTEHVFFRGLDGDVDKNGTTRSATVTDSNGVTYEDSDWKAGSELETLTYDGSTITQKSVTVPWTTVTATQTEDWGTRKARYVNTATTDTYVALTGGTWRNTRSVTTYDATTGRATQVNDVGEIGVADNQCTRTEYADDASLNMYAYVSRVEKVAVDCSTTPNRATQVISDDLTFYDGSTVLGTAPTKGDVTTTKQLSAHDGTTATYRTTAVTTYDDHGRPLVVKDAETASSATTYTASTTYTDTYGLATKSTVTNRLGWTMSTEYAPQWGLPSAKVEQNGRRTDLAYDGLGRLISVWLPDRPKASSFSPSLKYEYLVRGDTAPTAVHTQKIERDGTSYGSEWSLYDGLLRPRQEQTEGAGGGRMVADTRYDGSNRVVQVNDTYYVSGAPSSTLFQPVNADLDGQTVTEYDGASRVTASIFKVQGTEKYRTTYTYDGDRVTATPPAGGVKSTVVSDARVPVLGGVRLQRDRQPHQRDATRAERGGDVHEDVHLQPRFRPERDGLRPAHGLEGRGEHRGDEHDPGGDLPEHVHLRRLRQHPIPGPGRRHPVAGVGQAWRADQGHQRRRSGDVVHVRRHLGRAHPARHTRREDVLHAGHGAPSEQVLVHGEGDAVLVLQRCDGRDARGGRRPLPALRPPRHRRARRRPDDGHHHAAPHGPVRPGP
jgi:YD repeat-containing protein